MAIRILMKQWGLSWNDIEKISGKNARIMLLMEAEEAQKQGDDMAYQKAKARSQEMLRGKR